MSVSLADIAKKAKVSTAAVSKALRDMNDIAPATRKRIKKIAREMGYTVNIAARMLATRKTMTIGVVVPYPHIPTVIERLRGIQAVATEFEYATSIAFHDGDLAGEIRQLNILRGRVDGIVIVPSCASPELREAIRSLGIPFVCMSEMIPDMPADFAGIDDAEGGRLAARHLIDAGHERIAYLGNSPHTPSDQAILRGLNDVLGSASLVLDKSLTLWGNTEMAQTVANTDNLLAMKERPTALFASNDMAALWALKRLRQQGVAVPGNMALIGFDDIEFARLAEVPLTSVAQPNFDIGYQTATLLLDRLKPGKKNAPLRRVILPPRLVVRESSGRN